MGDSGASYNIVTLMKRLEAATSRLEDLTVYHAEALSKASRRSEEESTPAAESSLERTSSETASDSKGTLPGVSVSEPKSETGFNAEAIAAFKELLDDKLKKLADVSSSIDPLLSEQVSYLYTAFESEYKILQLTSVAKKPDYTSATFAEIFKPISSQGESIVNLREKNRGSKVANNLATIAEGIPAMAWVTIDETPVDFIKDFKDSAQFYANRVLKEFKSSDEKQVEWVSLITGFLGDLQDYVKKYFPKGLAWNENGRPLEEVKDSSISTSPAPISTGGGAPPPPPPPPPPLPSTDIFKDDGAGASKSSSSGGMDAVFSELNKGEGITSSLKKVDKSQQTHKNPSLRSASGKTPPPPPPKKPENLKYSSDSEKAKKKPPRKELDSTKWIIENFEDTHDLVIEGEITQGVFIDKCNNCTIQIKGKVSAITLNESNKVGVLAESLVSGVDIIKSNRFGFQITGVLPTLSIDQSHDGQVFLSKESLDTKIYTAQTSGLNINIPKEVEGDYTEIALPEQMLHKIEGNAITSTVVSLEE